MKNKLNGRVDLTWKSLVDFIENKYYRKKNICKGSSISNFKNYK